MNLGALDRTTSGVEKDTELELKGQEKELRQPGACVL